VSRRIIWGLLVLAAVMAGAWLLWPRPPEVQTLSIQSGEASRVLAVNGRIRPRLSVDVKSPVPGRVILLPFDVGQQVTQGTVMARIDDAPQIAAIRQAQSLLAAQQDVLAQAQRDQARYEKLGEIVGAQRVEQARLAVRQARDEVLRLTAAAEQAQEVRARHQIAAPFTGIVTERPVDPGQTVGVDTTLYRLADTTMPEVTAQVDELYAADLMIGMTALVSMPGQPKPLAARIAHLEERVDPATGARAVRLAFDQPPPRAPAGLTVSVNLIVERRREAISIPRSAILSPGAEPRVRVVANGGEVTDQRITFMDWPSEKVIVTSGLKPGMRILADPHAAAPGQRVRMAD
jgi:HlyD family secretion protein